MEDISLLEDKQGNTNNNQIKGFPCFIVLQRINKKIKIPCANKNIAKKVLTAYSNNNSNSKISLMWDRDFKAV